MNPHQHILPFAGIGGRRRNDVAVSGRDHSIVAVHIDRHICAELFQVRRALNILRPGARLVQRRQQHRSQNGDNCDNDQQFDQREVSSHGSGSFTRWFSGGMFDFDWTYSY